MRGRPSRRRSYLPEGKQRSKVGGVSPGMGEGLRWREKTVPPEEPVWAKGGRARKKVVPEHRVQEGRMQERRRARAKARGDSPVSRAEERGLYPEGKGDPCPKDGRGAWTSPKQMLSWLPGSESKQIGMHAPDHASPYLQTSNDCYQWLTLSQKLHGISHAWHLIQLLHWVDIMTYNLQIRKLGIS